MTVVERECSIDHRRRENSTSGAASCAQSCGVSSWALRHLGCRCENETVSCSS